MILTFLRRQWLNLFDNIKMFLFAFVIAPLLIGFGYGILYERMLDPTFDLAPVTVFIDNGLTETVSYPLQVAKEYLSRSAFANVTLENNHFSTDDLNAFLIERKSALYLTVDHGALKIYHGGSPTLEKVWLANAIEKALQSGFTGSSTASNTANISIESLQTDATLNSKARMMTSVATSISLFIAFSMASRFLKERETQIMQRFQVANISHYKIFFFEWLATASIAYGILTVQSLLMTLVLIRTPEAIASLPGFMLLNLIQSFVISAIFSIFIGFFRTEKTFKSWMTPLLMIIMILGGGFFPVDPEGIQGLFVQALPNFNLYKVYEAAQLQLPWSDQITAYAILLGWMIVPTLLGLWGFNQYNGYSESEA